MAPTLSNRDGKDIPEEVRAMPIANRTKETINKDQL